MLPTFNLIECEAYFRKTLSQPLRSAGFSLPHWIPTLSPPTVSFDDSPPSYREITRIINKCKSSASPCPFDQISAIMLKNCPILRTLLHSLMVQCWLQKDVPSCWKTSMTILIYKKGDEADPANFRPITLQLLLYKILSSLYRNRLHAFLAANGYIDVQLQKGFWPGCITEHTEMLTHFFT